MYVYVRVCIREYTLCRVSSSLPVALCPSAGICFESGFFPLFLSFSLAPPFLYSQISEKNIRILSWTDSVFFCVEQYENIKKSMRLRCRASSHDHRIISLPFFLNNL